MRLVVYMYESGLRDPCRTSTRTDINFVNQRFETCRCECSTREIPFHSSCKVQVTLEGRPLVFQRKPGPWKLVADTRTALVITIYFDPHTLTLANIERTNVHYL
jgi:hypothetical protein